jgi:hypothetical protein
VCDHTAGRIGLNFKKRKPIRQVIIYDSYVNIYGSNDAQPEAEQKKATGSGYFDEIFGDLGLQFLHVII